VTAISSELLGFIWTIDVHVRPKRVAWRDVQACSVGSTSDKPVREGGAESVTDFFVSGGPFNDELAVELTYGR
jgi:hypothetical protein